MKAKLIAYWITTILFCAAMGFGGVADLLRHESVREVLARLHYPEYLATILGVAKVLGVIALLLPGTRRLKEWAYAGFTFDLLGAFASHAFSGDPIKEMFPPVILLAIGAASYLLRPASRRLPDTPKA
ncbi:MAG: DoxX family protein [Planctomycetes bacterium]|nr:DoxX family protein [Planctomycetota bacterium]